MATIRLEGLSVFGHHGARPYEKEAGQRLEVDLELVPTDDRAEESDRLADAVDYDMLYRTVRDVVEGGRAAEAGIRAGDVIVEIDRRPVRTIEDFKARLEQQAKDAPVVMLVNRDGQTMYVAIPAA